MTDKPTIKYLTHKFTQHEWDFIMSLAFCDLPFDIGTAFVKGLRRTKNLRRFRTDVQKFLSL